METLQQPLEGRLLLAPSEASASDQGNWRSYHFALKGKRLYYYRSRDDKVPIKHIPVEQATSVDAFTHGTFPVPPALDGLVFTIRTPVREYHLACGNAAAVPSWVKILRDVVSSNTQETRAVENHDETLYKELRKGHDTAQVAAAMGWLQQQQQEADKTNGPLAATATADPEAEKKKKKKSGGFLRRFSISRIKEADEDEEARRREIEAQLEREAQQKRAEEEMAAAAAEEEELLRREEEENMVAEFTLETRMEPARELPPSPFEQDERILRYYGLDDDTVAVQPPPIRASRRSLRLYGGEAMFIGSNKSGDDQAIDGLEAEYEEFSRRRVSSPPPPPVVVDPEPSAEDKALKSANSFLLAVADQGITGVDDIQLSSVDEIEKDVDKHLRTVEEMNTSVGVHFGEDGKPQTLLERTRSILGQLNHRLSLDGSDNKNADPTIRSGVMARIEGKQSKPRWMVLKARFLHEFQSREVQEMGGIPLEAIMLDGATVQCDPQQRASLSFSVTGITGPYNFRVTQETDLDAWVQAITTTIKKRRHGTAEDTKEESVAPPSSSDPVIGIDVDPPEFPSPAPLRRKFGALHDGMRPVSETDATQPPKIAPSLDEIKSSKAWFSSFSLLRHDFPEEDREATVVTHHQIRVPDEPVHRYYDDGRPPSPDPLPVPPRRPKMSAVPVIQQHNTDSGFQVKEEEEGDELDRPLPQAPTFAPREHEPFVWEPLPPRTTPLQKEARIEDDQPIVPDEEPPPSLRTTLATGGLGSVVIESPRRDPPSARAAVIRPKDEEMNSVERDTKDAISPSPHSSPHQTTPPSAKPVVEFKSFTQSIRVTGDLVDDFESFVRLLRNTGAAEDPQRLESGEPLIVEEADLLGRCIVSSIIQILRHGLKPQEQQSGQWAQPSFWNVIRAFNSPICRDTVDQVESQRFPQVLGLFQEYIRCTLFVLDGLHLGFLESFVKSLSEDKTFLRQFFDTYAILLSSKRGAFMFGLRMLRPFRFECRRELKFMAPYLATPASALLTQLGQTPTPSADVSVVHSYFSELVHRVEDIALRMQRSAQTGEGGEDMTLLVRGWLATALAEILEFGFRSAKLFGRYHITDLFQQAVTEERSSTSGLAAGFSHVRRLASKDKDVHFRSLLCLGLNKRQLHAWISSLVLSERIVPRFFEPWAAVRSHSVRNSLLDSLTPLASLQFTLDVDLEC